MEMILTLKKLAQRQKRPDGSDYLALLLEDEAHLAGQYGISEKNVQLAALRQNIVPQRYCRNQRTLDNADQIRLLESHVVVVGQGGLGGTVTEILARLGIGELTLVDGDRFEESNLNRQLLATMSNLGEKKVFAGKKRVKQINSAVSVNAVADFFTRDNGEDIVGSADIVIDCLDSIPDRFVVQESCQAAGVVFISAAIGGTAGQTTVIFPDDPGLHQIYGESTRTDQEGNKTQLGIETQLGTPAYGAVFMAAIECAEAVKILCTSASSLQNKLLISDISDYTLEQLSFPSES